MAKAKYKLEEAKKDKTLSFRIANQTFNLLKKLSQNNRVGINIYARDKLIEYIYSKYPEDEGDLNTLYKEKSELEKMHREIFDAMHEIDIERTIHVEHIKEINRRLTKLNKNREDINSRMIFIDDKIKQYEEMKSE